MYIARTIIPIHGIRAERSRPYERNANCLDFGTLEASNSDITAPPVASIGDCEFCSAPARRQRRSVMQRRRFKQSMSLQERLAAWAKSVRAKAAKLKPGPERDALLQRASQADTAAHFDDWANSTELQPPK